MGMALSMKRWENIIFGFHLGSAGRDFLHQSARRVVCLPEG
jgi:hypothetical protein